MSDVLGGQPVRACAVTLAPLETDDSGLGRAYESDIRTYGRVMNFTRAAAASPTTWQALTRSQHMFAALRRVDERTCAFLCLYTSMLNGCTYCVDDAAGAALRLGVSPETLLALPAVPHDESGSRLSVTLDYGRAVALCPADIDESLLAEVRAFLDDETLLEVTAVVSMKCFWNRFAISLRLPPEGHCEDPGLVRALHARGRELTAADGRP